MIKRYDLTKDELQEVEDGGWVRYEDHAAEVERLRDTFDHTRHQVCDALEVDRGLGWTSLCMEITHIYYDHATEVERMRAENERLRARVAELEEETERLRWVVRASCVRTPTPGCECPGCETARERAAQVDLVDSYEAELEEDRQAERDRILGARVREIARALERGEGVGR